MAVAHAQEGRGYSSIRRWTSYFAGGKPALGAKSDRCAVASETARAPLGNRPGRVVRGHRKEVGTTVAWGFMYPPYVAMVRFREKNQWVW